MYYLETSSLRQLINKLDKVTLNKCFTSNLSIMELISGIINESEYQKRKNIIKSVYNKKVKVDFYFPDDIILQSFPRLSFEELKLKDFNNVCNIILNSNSLLDYYKKEKKQKKLRFNLDYFVGFDNRYNNTFITNSVNGNKKINELFETKPISSLVFSAEEENLSKDEILNLWQNKYKDINVACTIFAIVKAYAKKNEYNKIDDSYNENLKEILLSYNGNINYYVEIFSYYTMNKLIQSNQPKENDVFDLQHFLYLRNSKNICMVSDDKLLHNICNKLYPNKKLIIGTNDLLNL